jgi:ABC-2 type transport system permease protein
VVYLAVWTTVAGAGNVGGLTANDFSTYYLTLLIVDTLTSDITIHLLASKIQDGTLSSDLLKPVHPILTNILVNNLAFKTLTFAVLVPIWLVLCLLFQPDFSGVSALSLLLAVPSLLLGFGISFLLGATITCIAFWTTRVYALNEFYYALIVLFSGQFVPLDLMPRFIQQISPFLPFQLMKYVPVQIILGHLPPEVVARDLLLGLLWLGVAAAIFGWVWRNGVKRFSAVGA